MLLCAYAHKRIESCLVVYIHTIGQTDGGDLWLSLGLKFLSILSAFSKVPMFLIQTYRGTATGWQTVGIRPAKTAGDFLILLAKVRPDYSHRLKPVV